MIDLISVLILFYSVDGVEMESEMQLPAAQCQAAERGITKAIGSNGGPTVELWNGAVVPVRSTSCLHGCMNDDGMPDLELITALIDDEHGAADIRMN